MRSEAEHDPGGDRTRDLRINVPLRLSPPALARTAVRGLDCPFAFTARRAVIRHPPSSLYTFRRSGLARGWQLERSPTLTGFTRAISDAVLLLKKSPLLYQLSYRVV
jgi:hypothetical protein